MFCKDCRLNVEGRCHSEKIGEGYSEDWSDSLVYDYQEGGGFSVGDMFGCVHFEKKDTVKIIEGADCDLEEIASRKTGSKEMALFRDEDGRWSFDLGNPSPHVMLGEVRGELCVEGSSLKEVVQAMKKRTV